jgi:hypothetical protein
MTGSARYCEIFGPLSDCSTFWGAACPSLGVAGNQDFHCLALARVKENECCCKSNVPKGIQTRGAGRESGKGKATLVETWSADWSCLLGTKPL